MNWIAVLLLPGACAAGAGPDAAEAASGEAEKRPALTEPGVVLTFDDTFVSQWVAAMPLFEKCGAHATFFVTGFDELTPEQVAGLQRLRQAGHAVGCHGLRHRKAVEYTEQHSLDAYLRDDVTPAVALMDAAGLHPTSFAYPCSNNNEATDAALLERFRHLRTGAYPTEGERIAQLDAIFTPINAVAARGCFAGRSMDRAGEPGHEDGIAQVTEALDRALEKRELVVLYSHNIGTENRNHILPGSLEQILAHAKRIGLRFYTFDDLP
ncbi:MAG: polysaccharide deacetylase family protein [Candidatus Hydrogenedentes bacterium]|nr:polysaccharide deacetylase family protein [Candidatus Hydrogenedentota bacterium]